MTAVEQASATLDALRARHRQENDRQIAIGVERRDISYAAHTGDAKARRRLTAINIEFATANSEIDSISEAIKRAEIDLAEAKSTELKSQMRQKAEEVRSRLGRFQQLGAEIDQHAKLIAEKYKELEAEVLAIGKLRAPIPSLTLMRSNGKRAMFTLLLGTPIELMRLSPSERTTFASLTDSWITSMDRWASAHLGDRQEIDDVA